MLEQEERRVGFVLGDKHEVEIFLIVETKVCRRRTRKEERALDVALPCIMASLVPLTSECVLLYTTKLNIFSESRHKTSVLHPGNLDVNDEMRFKIGKELILFNVR